MELSTALLERERVEVDSRWLKYGTDFNTWLFAYRALGLVMDPEASLREYKITFVSTNRPEEMESFRASRKGKVQAGIVGCLRGGMISPAACTGYSTVGHLYTLGVAILLTRIVWLGIHFDQWDMTHEGEVRRMTYVYLYTPGALSFQFASWCFVAGHRSFSNSI